ncbi:uncharacterized protein LOC110250066 [Exaiptasia diaphana]|uniref:SH2 domain-containing protein n=1 Tax=Exaiptasia diaphana TaxID=2652724 RepID=A0A913XYP4_EXADI|nr:uncharacterized protein LOC110250066 [Exaiptasia diaphana]
MSMIAKFKRRSSAPNLDVVNADKQKPALTRRQSEKSMRVPTIPEAIPETPKTMPKYYIQGLDRESSENLLHEQPVGTFLLRDRQSSNIPGSYTLSMRDKSNQCRHFKIDTNPRNGKLAIHGYQDHQFESLEKLIDFFVKKQKNAEVSIKPYGCEVGPAPNVLYEDMNDGIDSYQTINPDVTALQCTPRKELYENFDSKKSPPAPTRPNYENIDSKTSPPVPTRPNYENIDSKTSPPVPTRPNHENGVSKPSLPPTTPNTKPSYENIGKKGGMRRPPPPQLPETDQNYEDMIPEPRTSTLPFKLKPAEQPGPYQNLPPRGETLPLPPRRPPPITGTSRTKRKGSLPANFESYISREASHPPPPLPARPHASTNYQNLPGRGSTTVDCPEVPQRRHPLHRSYTEPDTRF